MDNQKALDAVLEAAQSIIDSAAPEAEAVDELARAVADLVELAPESEAVAALIDALMSLVDEFAAREAQ
jgi:ABC-type transporter Mla subunit MlaD